MHKDISIRTDLREGDLSGILDMHRDIYKKEYGYGVEFENYVRAGLCEFDQKYDPQCSKVWICENNNKIKGSLILENRGTESQLRFFLIEPEFRGKGLGKTLLKKFLDFVSDYGYRSAYLWTTNEQEKAIELYCKSGFVLTNETSSDRFGKKLIEMRFDYFI
ncbi:MAG TPA: GNAT family N-acetyltransferase [Ignavibacteria bacterium]|nr:GNAT family N-acetyltransferase [Ignavibacteria bacterium]